MPTYLNTWSPQSQYFQPNNPSLGAQNPDKSAQQLGLAPYATLREAKSAWRADGGTDAIRGNYNYTTPSGGAGNIAADYLAQQQRLRAGGGAAPSGGGNATTPKLGPIGGAYTPAAATTSSAARSYTSTNATTDAKQNTPNYSAAAREVLNDSFKIKQPYGVDLTLPQTQADFDAHQAALAKFTSARELADQKLADEKAFREQRWQTLQQNFEQNRDAVRSSNAGVLQQLRANADTRKNEIDLSTQGETTRQVQYLAGKNALMSSLGQGSLGRIRSEGERLKSTVENEYGNKVADINSRENEAVTGLQKDLQQNLLTIEQSEFTSSAEHDAAVQSAYAAALTDLGTIKSAATTARREAEKEAADRLFKEKELATNSALKGQANAIEAAKADQTAQTELAKFVHFETARDGSVVGIRADGSALNFGKIGLPQKSSGGGGGGGAAKPYEPTLYKDYAFELQNGLLPASVKTYDDYRFYKLYGVPPNGGLPFGNATATTPPAATSAAADSGWTDSLVNLFNQAKAFF